MQDRGPLATLAAVPLLAGALAGCGDATAPAGADGPPVPSGPTGRVLGEGTVLDAGGGAQLCLGGVAESLPPQCGGPEVTNWDWGSVTGFDEASGTRWGEYVVVGTYADGRFTLTEPPVPSEEYDGPRAAYPEDSLATPCPEPAGGWAVVDPERTTPESLDEVARAAAGLPGYAGLWLDQSVNPAADRLGADPEAELAMNDPTRLVVNVRVVGDTRAAAAELRSVWGGALCVSAAERTEAELRAVQERLGDLPGMLSSGVAQDRVQLSVVHDDGSLQRRLDAEYGSGVVEVSSALRPYQD